MSQVLKIWKVFQIIIFQMILRFFFFFLFLKKKKKTIEQSKERAERIKNIEKKIIKENKNFKENEKNIKEKKDQWKFFKVEKKLILNDFFILLMLKYYNEKISWNISELLEISNKNISFLSYSKLYQSNILSSIKQSNIIVFFYFNLGIG
jgi:hypothetical protein